MVKAQSTEFRLSTMPMRGGDRLDSDRFAQLRRRLVLDACKWDPQVGDVSTISTFPLLLSRDHWHTLKDLATRLSTELMSAEIELLHRPELHRRLGLPRGIRNVLARAGELGATPAAARTLRFDFHWTADGWQISEVNSDVPGGFCEAWELSSLMAEHYADAQPAGNPGAAWADAFAASVTGPGPIAMLAAAGFMEDQQVLAYLERLLNQRGLATRWAAPGALGQQSGEVFLDVGGRYIPLGAIVRFFQAEWINARRMPYMFVGGKTPVANPGIAILTESKRFPLVWDELSTPMPTWRKLLPETRAPRDASWRIDNSWLVKSAFCNTGDTVIVRSLLTDHQWNRATRWIPYFPGGWIAQRRFDIEPVDTPDGAVYPCIGVYTIDGSPSGIYGRYARTPLIDLAAVDVAVLIADETEDRR